MSRNHNHPSKGYRIMVEPIRDPKYMETIKHLLKNRSRDRLLVTMGINNGHRVGDLLLLKVGQVCHMKPGQSIPVREGKTGKANLLMMNRSTYKVLQHYMEELSPADEDFLFKSVKCKNRPLTTSSVNNLVKSWCRAVNLQDHYVAHTQRQTFGCIQQVHYGVGFEVLAKRFNRSNLRNTMRYLCVTGAEVNGIPLNEI